jgi:hypothetical protein
MSGSVAEPYLSRASTTIRGYNRWNRVAIAFRSKFISTSGLYRGHFEFPTSTDRRAVSANVGIDRGSSGKVETVVIDVGIASPSLSVQNLFPLPVS